MKKIMSAFLAVVMTFMFTISVSAQDSRSLVNMGGGVISCKMYPSIDGAIIANSPYYMVPGTANDRTVDKVPDNIKQFYKSHGCNGFLMVVEVSAGKATKYRTYSNGSVVEAFDFRGSGSKVFNIFVRRTYFVEPWINWKVRINDTYGWDDYQEMVGYIADPDFN